jgi:hypothetical protein
MLSSHCHLAEWRDETMEKQPSAPDLLDAVSEEEELSQIIPAIFNGARHVATARWTFARDEDEDAPEIVCVLSDGDEIVSRVLSQSSRSEGHGLRPPLAQKTELENSEEFPSVIVTLYI